MIIGLLIGLVCSTQASAADVRVKDLGRFLGWRDNALVGYGIVTGLSGSGDTPHSAVTQRALANVLSKLGSNISPEQVQSRNVAVVVVTATLPAAANVGDKIDVSVTSIGDARSLAGGTLLLTTLLGPDQRPYALAQGALVVGGYRFDASLNREQKNYPTSGMVPRGASVEAAVTSNLVGRNNDLVFVLNDPDFTTAERIKSGIDAMVGFGSAKVLGASSVSINAGAGGGDVYALVARIESVVVRPDTTAQVVINERTGTVVSGGDVQISSVVISQGDIRVSVSARTDGEPPSFAVQETGRVRSVTATNARLDVDDARNDVVIRFPDSTVADLVVGLAKAHIDTRRMIAILQAMRAAGSLHAEIIVQ